MNSRYEQQLSREFFGAEMQSININSDALDMTDMSAQAKELPTNEITAKQRMHMQDPSPTTVTI